MCLHIQIEHIYVYVYVIIYTYIYIYIYRYVYIYACMHACMHVCIHVCIHTHLSIWAMHVMHRIPPMNPAAVREFKLQLDLERLANFRSKNTRSRFPDLQIQCSMSANFPLQYFAGPLKSEHLEMYEPLHLEIWNPEISSSQGITD